MTTLLEIFNSHLTNGRQVLSYEHPGAGMINNQMMKDIVNDVAANLAAGTLRSDDLHVRINYYKPDSKQGNTKLRGIVYMGSHPAIDCYLDGLKREQPSCTGLFSWCYVFSDFFYKSFGKQLSMLANSILYYLEPERAKQEINAWIAANKDKIVKDRNGHIPFRVSETGDCTYFLHQWIDIAAENSDINFYLYSKQFDLINTVPYNITERYPNLQVILSDSTVGDPNPITKVREDYRSFAVDFKNVDLTPASIKALKELAEYPAHKCPGAKAGCFHCAKCSEAATRFTKVIVADEH